MKLDKMYQGKHKFNVKATVLGNDSTIKYLNKNQVTTEAQQLLQDNLKY